MKRVDKITIFRDFPEDRRRSMDIYSDNIYKYLIKINTSIPLTNFIPKISYLGNWFGNHLLTKMRFSRYFTYPILAYQNRSIVNHIIDQSYGHLLYTLPYRNSIITIHDIIPILAWEKQIEGLSYPNNPLLMKFSLSKVNKARYIIAVSQNTKNDLMKFCSIQESKIKVIHCGVSNIFEKYSIEKKELIRKNLGLPDHNTKLVFIVGENSYKNQETSIKIINELEKRNFSQINLVTLGLSVEYVNKLKSKTPLKNKIFMFNNLSEKEIVDLYNSVDCLLFPSLYEGFGLPVLEAMACGIPVVCSNAASLPEIAKDAAILASPFDIIKMSDGIEMLFKNNQFKNELIEKGLKNALNFTWEKCAIEINKLYETIIYEKTNIK